MSEVDITRLSSKGQVVIPFEMRKGLKEGDKLLIMKSGDMIVMRKASNLDSKFIKEFESARRMKSSFEKAEKGKDKPEEEFKYPSYLR